MAVLSDFSAYLKRLVLKLTGNGEKELRDAVSHQVSVNASPESRLSHSFTVEQDSTDQISHQLNILFNGEGSVSHEFNLDQINVESILSHGVDVSHIDASTLLSHSFGVEEDSTDILSHQLDVFFRGTSSLTHELNINLINTEDLLTHEINIDAIDNITLISHSFGVHEDAANNLSHQLEVPTPQESFLSHSFGLPSVRDTAALSHQLYVPEINDYENLLSHSFGVPEDTQRNISHQILVAFPGSDLLSHQFAIVGINEEDLLTHQVDLGIGLDSISHEFSAIGVGLLNSNLSHQIDVSVIQPSYVLTNQLRVQLDLGFVETTISGFFRIVPEGIYQEDNTSEILIAYPGIRYSYSDPNANPVTSSGTWQNIDPAQVIPSVASGLNEADYMLGSMVFENESEILIPDAGEDHWHTTLSVLNIAEHNFDVLVNGQAWQSPVVKTGANGWRGLNDPDVRLPNMGIFAGEDFFPPFFGRQETISGVFKDIVGFFGDITYSGLNLTSGDDPALILSDQFYFEDVLDPLQFTSSEINGSPFFPLEKDLLLSGIFLDNGLGGDPREDDLNIRLGFTLGEASPQPDILQWSIGVNQPSGVFTQTQETDQWLASGYNRNFTVPPLLEGDQICGRVRAATTSKSSSYTGSIPTDIIQMASTDPAGGVGIAGYGIANWNDFVETEVILDICLDILETLRKGVLPHGITMKHEDKNNQGKVLKLYKDPATDEIRVQLITPSVSFNDNDLQGTAILKKNVSNRIVTSVDDLSRYSIVRYKKPKKNSMFKYLIIDEEE